MYTSGCTKALYHRTHISRWHALWYKPIRPRQNYVTLLLENLDFLSLPTRLSRRSVSIALMVIIISIIIIIIIIMIIIIIILIIIRGDL